MQDKINFLNSSFRDGLGNSGRNFWAEDYDNGGDGDDDPIVVHTNIKGSV